MPNVEFPGSPGDEVPQKYGVWSICNGTQHGLEKLFAMANHMILRSPGY